MVGFVVFLLSLGLLLLAVFVYRSRWRCPLGLHAEMRQFVAALVVLAAVGALYGIVSAALRADTAERALMARCAEHPHTPECTTRENSSRRG